MEPKRELTSVDLAAVVTELSPLEGAKVDKVYRYGEDLLRLKMRDFERGRIELFVEVGDRKRVHTVAPERVPDAPERPPEFAKMLRSRLSGADFAGVEQFEFDRILEFVFEREDATTRIIVECFGEGNVVVTNGEYEVVACFETVRLQSRTVAPGARYAFPESRVNPLVISREDFGRVMEASDTDVVRTLATQLNVGGLYAEELCTRAGVEKTLDIADADGEIYDRLYGAIERLASRIRDGDFDPRLYTDAGDDAGEDDGTDDGNRPDDGKLRDDPSTERDSTVGGGPVLDVTPFPLEEHTAAGLESTAFGSFMAALDAYFDRLERDDRSETPGSARPDFEAEIEKKGRIIDQQEGAIESFEKDAEAERERAESLYANYGLVDEILSTVRSARTDGTSWEEIADRFDTGAEQGIAAAEAVLDVDGENGRVTIEVDGQAIPVVVADGVEKNADRLYKEAKRIEEKRSGALEAIENTREELDELLERRDAWEREEAGDDEPVEESVDRSDRDWLADRSIPIRENEPWYDRFRWFHTSDEFLVIGGRNADQNEELVRKYLEPGDRVFHTQAHGGPVTVLKATDPSESAVPEMEFPASSIEEAAQFAVSYASVWKDGRFAGDVYEVAADQVTKTPESGEYLEKGGFAIRGDRTYHRDTPVGVAVGIQCEPWTRVIGGPQSAIEDSAVTTIAVEPGRYAQADVAKRIYRQFRERFTDEAFVRKVASPDRIQHFLPPGGSRIVGE